MRGNGLGVLCRVHPSPDSCFGRMTRRYLLEGGRAAHVGAALYYMLDVLRSTALYGGRKDAVRVFTRYLMGTAYLPSPVHEAAYRFFAAALPTSDLMFLLDVSPEEAYRRLEHRRDGAEMFETPEQLRRVRAKVLGLARKYGWTVIDADRDALKVHRDIVRCVVEKTGLDLR